MRLFLIFSVAAAFLSSCSQPSNRLKVMASPVPHAEMLEFIKPDLESHGYDLEIILTDDYNIPNQALANKEIDANFFQHIPFLEEQVKQFHYPLLCYAKVEIEPMGLYSKKYRSSMDIPQNAIIAIPNDPTNEGRALLLLQSEGMIKLASKSGLSATPLSIIQNPKHLKFREIDAAMLPRTLEDVDAAMINTNYALQAGLSPEKDALALENKESPYVNVLVIRKGEEQRFDLEALAKALTSDRMRSFIQEKYQGAILPAFSLSCVN